MVNLPKKAWKGRVAPAKPSLISQILFSFVDGPNRRTCMLCDGLQPDFDRDVGWLLEKGTGRDNHGRFHASQFVTLIGYKWEKT